MVRKKGKGLKAKARKARSIPLQQSPVRKFKKNRWKQVWVCVKDLDTGHVFEVVHKPLYGLWFRDAINRQQTPDAAPKWVVCADQGLETTLCHENGNVQITSKGKFKPRVGAATWLQRRMYSVEQGYKPWEIAPAWYCDGIVYKTNKFQVGDWINWYEVPVDGSVLVDEYGRPASLEDRNKYLVKVPKHLEEVSGQYPNDPLLDMLVDSHKTKDRLTAMHQRVDEEVAQKMDNGVRVNPLLQQIYGKKTETTPLSVTKAIRKSVPEPKFSDVKFVPGANNAYTAGRTIDQFDREYNGRSK